MYDAINGDMTRYRIHSGYHGVESDRTGRTDIDGECGFGRLFWGGIVTISPCGTFHDVKCTWMVRCRARQTAGAAAVRPPGQQVRGLPSRSAHRLQAGRTGAGPGNAGGRFGGRFPDGRRKTYINQRLSAQFDSSWRLRMWQWVGGRFSIRPMCRPYAVPRRVLDGVGAWYGLAGRPSGLAWASGWTWGVAGRVHPTCLPP